MAKKDKQTFIDKPKDELIKMLGEKREELRKFRFSMKGSRTRNTKGGAALRKDIARILTARTAQERSASTH